MVLATCPERVVVVAEVRVVDAGLVCRGHQREAQIGRASLGHVLLVAVELPGLIFGRVDPGVGHELPRIVEAVWVADLGGYGRGVDRTNARYRPQQSPDLGVQQLADLGIEPGYLGIEMVHQFECVRELERKRVGGIGRPDGRLGGGLDLLGLDPAVPPAACAFDRFRQRADVGRGHLGRRAVVAQDCPARRRVPVAEQPLKLGEEPVGDRRRAVLQRGALLDQVGSVARQLLEPIGSFGRHARGAEPLEPGVLGNEERVHQVGLGLADRIGLAEGVDQDGVDDCHAEAMVVEERPERHPVMARRLHDDQAAALIGIELAKALEQGSEALLVVGELKGLPVRRAVVEPGGCDVGVLGDVDSDVLQGSPFPSWPGAKVLLRDLRHAASLDMRH